MAKKSAAKPVESAEVVDLRQQVEYWKARAEAAEEGMRTTTRALLASQRRYVEEVVKAATLKRSCEMQAETATNPEPQWMRFFKLTVQDRPWSDYPLGTKAYAYNGGYWIRVSDGWKWNSGSTFPTPGGDACGRCVLLPEENGENAATDTVADKVSKAGVMPQNPESNFSATVQDANAAAAERPSFVMGDRVRVVASEHPYYGWEGYVYQIQYVSKVMVRCNVRLRNGNIVCAEPSELART